MKRFVWLKRGAVCLAPLLVILMLSSLLAVSPVNAQGGFALSGSFYRQNFEIPQGSSVSGPDIYITVFNNSQDELGVRMTSQAPVGVNINLSQYDFTLSAGSQQKILVGVDVTKDAAPGEYKLTVTAESYKEGATGIQISGAASQSANLTVLGESGLIKVEVLNPEGQPIAVGIRIYRVINGQNYEVAFSETGILEKIVAPGNFIASTYVGGEKRDEQTFTIAKDENKVITLSAATVYFEGFGIVPAYQKDTNELAFVQVTYTVRNLYKSVEKAEVILEVSRDGTKLEEISLANLSPLDLGRAGLNYNYIPSDGWENGAYSFKLRLNLDGKPYATTLEETLNVSVGSAHGGGISPLIIGVIIAGVLIIAGAGVFVWRKRHA